MLICRTLEDLKIAIAQLTSLEVGYTRVSTELSHQDSSVARQIQDFKEVGCNISLVERDSGTTIDRRFLYQELIELINQGLVAKVVVDESNRLNRNELETTYFERLCEINSVPLIYLNQPELNGNSESVSESVKLLRKEAAIEAESFSRHLGKRIRKGYARRKKNIKPIANKPTFGYRFTSDRYYEIDWAKEDLSNVIGRDRAQKKLWATGELAEFLIEKYIELESQSQAFKQFKLLLDSLEVIDRDRYNKAKNKSQTWFGGWIKDPTIRGHLAYNRYKTQYKGNKLEKKVRVKVPQTEWEIHKDCHPALITWFQWQQIERIIKQNKNKGWARQNATRDRTIPAPLSKLLRCDCCKLTFNTQSTNQKGKKYRYYRCVGRRELRCDRGGIAEGALVQCLIDKIIESAEELTEILYAAKIKQKDPRSDRLVELRQEADETLKLFETKGRQSYLLSYQEIIAEIKDLEKTIAQSATQLEEKKEVLSALQDRDFWDSMTRTELHEYLKALVRTAWIGNKRVVAVELYL